MFAWDNKSINESSVECIPRMVNQEQNERLNSNPTMTKLQKVVVSMNPHSAVEPDGINGYFFQTFCHIIKSRLDGSVFGIFQWTRDLHVFSHSCIVLLPKMNNPIKLKCSGLLV